MARSGRTRAGVEATTTRRPRTSATDAPGPSRPPVDDDAIYRRTAAGERAIDLTSQRLTRIARRVLHLVDGIRPVGDLPPVVTGDELPTILRDLLERRLIEQVGTRASGATTGPHPDLALARIKRALAGALIRELGDDGAVLEARVQDCVNLAVLRNVVAELVELVATRKSRAAADRIAAIVRSQDRS